MLELADEADSKSVGSDTVRVRPPPPAPENPFTKVDGFLFVFLYIDCLFIQNESTTDTRGDKMININNWLEIFLSALDDTFNDRIWFVGLQGSYAHNEATQESDIDIVVILDKLSSEDISLYNSFTHILHRPSFDFGVVYHTD